MPPRMGRYPETIKQIDRRCPECEEPLLQEGNNIWCPDCGNVYPTNKQRFLDDLSRLAAAAERIADALEVMAHPMRTISIKGETPIEVHIPRKDADNA